MKVSIVSYNASATVCYNVRCYHWISKFIFLFFFLSLFFFEILILQIGGLPNPKNNKGLALINIQVHIPSSLLPTSYARTSDLANFKSTPKLVSLTVSLYNIM